MHTENCVIIRSVFEASRIETSSDFIVTVYEVCKRTDPIFCNKISIVFGLEYNNFEYSSDKNVQYVTDLLKKYKELDYNKLIIAYESLIDYLTKESSITSIFPLNEFDYFGHKIFNELFLKLEYCINKLEN